MYNDQIAELQGMLRFMEISENGASGIYPSGRYDGVTKAAVTDFQGRHGMKQSGVVDNATWEAVVTEYDEAAMNVTAPVRVSFFPPKAGYSVGRGDSGDLVTVIQIILNELRRSYDGYPFIDVSGEYGKETEDAVKAVQRAHRLEPNGRVDKTTWNHIASEYNFLAGRSDE